MSVFRNKSEILLLEPCDGKLSRTVLSGGKARDHFKRLPIAKHRDRHRKIAPAQRVQDQDSKHDQL